MIRFILADLRRLWPGALAILLLVAVAVGLGATVTLQERALRLGSARAADSFDLVIGARGSETQLVLSTVFLQTAPLPLVPGSMLADLAADPRVAWAAPVGFGDFFQNRPLVGTTATLIAAMAPRLAEGRVFQRAGEAVVGAQVDLPMGAEIVPTHGVEAQGGQAHSGVAYRVTGRMPPTGTAWDRAILVPIGSVWSVHGMGGGDDEHDHADARDHPAVGTAHPDSHDAGEHREGGDHEATDIDHPAEAQDGGEHGEVGAHHHDGDGDEEGGGDELHHGRLDPDAPLVERFTADSPAVPAILVKPRTIADAYKLRQQYRADGRSLAVFPGEVLTGLYALLGDARAVLAAVAAGAQLLVAAALLLVAVIHVGQRRQQIGALRAFGATRGTVFALVWGELFALSAAGVALGCVAGTVATRAISARLEAERGFAMPLELVPADTGRLALVLAVAALAAAIPALAAYRQSPAENLRR